LKKKSIAQVSALLIFVYLTFILQLHLVGDEIHNSVLFWNSQEAYLFARWSRAGYHFSCFQYVLWHIPAFFGVNHTYDNLRSSTLVIRITPNRIDRYVSERDPENPKGDPVDFRGYIPGSQTVYAFDMQGDLWKWVGTDFERVRPEERLSATANDDTFARGDFQIKNGWSARHDLYSWPARSTIELNDKPIGFLLKRGDSRDELSLELQLPDGVSQTALHVSRTLHLVGKTRYREMFEKPSTAEE
jgi:hypothetical protein